MENNEFSGVLKSLQSQTAVSSTKTEQNIKNTESLLETEKTLVGINQRLLQETEKNTAIEKQNESVLKNIFAVLNKQFILQQATAQEDRLTRATTPTETETEAQQERELRQTATKIDNGTGQGGGGGGLLGVIGAIAGVTALLGSGGILGTLAGISAGIAALVGIVTVIKTFFSGKSDEAKGGGGGGGGNGGGDGGDTTLEELRRRYGGDGPEGQPQTATKEFSGNESSDDESDSSSKTKLKGKTKIDQAMNFFVKKGWSKEDASAIVGNLRAESGDFSDDVISGKKRGDNETAAGIAQWRGERQTKFKKRYKEDLNKGASFENQLNYVDYELTKGDYKEVGKRLKQAKTIEEKTGIVNADYEVSKDGRRGNHGPRIKLARNAYTTYKPIKDDDSTTAVKYDPKARPEGTPRSLVFDQLKAGKTIGKDLELPSNVHLAGSAKKWGLEGVDPALIEGISGAAKNWKGTVDIFSTKRKGGDKGNHSAGRALDVRLYDEKGKEYIPKKDWGANGPGHSRKANGSEYNAEVYKTFMQDAVAWGSQYDPKMKNARWGGHFRTKTPDDWMHLDTMYGKGSPDNMVRSHMGMSVADWRKERFGIDGQETRYAEDDSRRSTQAAKPKSASRYEEEEEEEEQNEPVLKETATKQFSQPKPTAQKTTNNLVPDVYDQPNTNVLLENYGVNPIGGGINQPQPMRTNYPNMSYPGIGGFGANLPGIIGMGVGMGMGGRTNIPGMIGIGAGMIPGMLGGMRGYGSPVLGGIARTMGGIGSVMQTGQMIGQMGRFSGNAGILGGMNTANMALGGMSGLLGLGQNIIGGLSGLFSGRNSPSQQPKVPQLPPVKPPTPDSTRFGKTLNIDPSKPSTEHPNPNITWKSDPNYKEHPKPKPGDPFYDIMTRPKEMSNQPIPDSTRFGKTLEKVSKPEENSPETNRIKKELDNYWKFERGNDKTAKPVPDSTRFGKTLEKTPKPEEDSSYLDDIKKDIDNWLQKGENKGTLTPNQTTRGKALESMTVQTNVEREQQMSPANAPPPIVNVDGQGGGGGGQQREVSGGSSPSPDAVMGSSSMTFRTDDPTIWHIMYGNARSV